ncbi:BspA family leucine-rich repeat surface protein [Prevotella dentasini]|uniref:BspA family leucine-rich repeat surface protein n=1 Tax=Prevotella dentasini TaxID=589537 RepID=UPI000A7544B6|nr:BspA family leucine-rich repeat surface protein [Prevotella dentasini]
MKTNLFKNMTTAIAALFIAMATLPQKATAQAKEAYVVVSEDQTTLTFYYDAQRADRKGTVWGIGDTQKDEKGKIYPAWAGTSFIQSNETITTAVFNASFKDYRPTSTRLWFGYCSTLKEIGDMENLNTEDVTDMGYMFAECDALKSLDLSGFNTKNVTNMKAMFISCYALQSLDLSGFNTENVTDMEAMFAGCEGLKSLDLSGFNTKNVTNMSGMFYNGTNLQSLDLSGFDTENVTDMSSMFYNCETLKSLNLSGFNTENVTDMYTMFAGCDVQSLDLSGFNTKNVTDMRYMFSGCDALTTIYNNDTWTCGKSEGMFSDCTQLVGAVAYDNSKTDVTMANPETGYFTRKTADGIASAATGAAPQPKGIYSLQASAWARRPTDCRTVSTS